MNISVDQGLNGRGIVMKKQVDLKMVHYTLHPCLIVFSRTPIAADTFGTGNFCTGIERALKVIFIFALEYVTSPISNH